MTTDIKSEVKPEISSKIKKVTFIAAFMCFLAGTFYCYEYFLRVAPSVMTVELMQAFNISNTSLGVLVAFYYYAYTPAQIPVGIMMDRYGPRRILTFACLVCAVGTVIFTGNNFPLAALGRFLVGFGSAFAFVGVLKITSLWLPRKYFAFVTGLCTLLGTFGAMGGQVLMTDFLRLWGWKQALYYSALVGLILTVIIWLFIKDKTDKDIKQKTAQSHENKTVWEELKEVMSNKIIWYCGIIGCLAYLPLSVFAEMWSTPFLESSGFTKSDAAYGSSLLFLGFGIGGPIWGWFSDYIKSRKIPLILGNILAAITSFYIIWYASPSEITKIEIALFLCGVFASAEILVFAIGNDSCPPRLTATTVAFINMLVMAGGILFQPMVGYIVDFLYSSAEVITDNIYVANHQDYTKALLILPVGLILGSIISYIMQETYVKE